MLHVGPRAGKGILVGAVGGAAIFSMVGVVLVVIGWPVALFAGLALAGAAIGGTVGAFIGVERGVGMSEGWEQTFHEPRTMAVPVEVHPTSAAETATARRFLEDHRSLAVRESSGAGR